MKKLELVLIKAFTHLGKLDNLLRENGLRFATTLTAEVAVAGLYLAIADPKMPYELKRSIGILFAVMIAIALIYVPYERDEEEA